MQSTPPGASPQAYPSIADQMTQIYVFVDDHLKAHPAQAQWRRSNNAAPALTDAEVITVALMQGVFGISSSAAPPSSAPSCSSPPTGGWPSRACAATASGSPACTASRRSSAR